MALADVIINSLGALIEDPYGNYLVQNVLKLDSAEKSDMIFRVIAKDFIRLSQLKFSSNVIEKCLDSERIGSQVD
jgi:pumilio RNA-binding family